MRKCRAESREEEEGGYSPRRVKMRGRRYTSGKGTDDYWAPKPRITGITPGICNRALGRQSATDFAAIPLSLSLSLPLSPSFRPTIDHHSNGPPLPRLKLCSSVSGTLFNRATFLHRPPENLQIIWIMEERERGKESRSKETIAIRGAVALFSFLSISVVDIRLHGFICFVFFYRSIRRKLYRSVNSGIRVNLN